MAKLTPVILDEDPNEDGTWNVKIRIGHKSKSAYIGTDEFVSKRNLVNGREIKSSFIVSNLTDILKKYNDILKKKDYLVKDLTHLQVKQLLETYREDGEEEQQDVMFLAFCSRYIAGVKVKGTASVLNTAHLCLNDYLEGKDIPAKQITSSFLKSYEAYLRTPRSGMRLNNGQMKLAKFKALDNTGVNIHMNGIKRLLNFAKDEFNDEEIGMVAIPNNPFKKFVIVDLDEPESRDFSLDQIVRIRDCSPAPGSRAELVRDLWMLSFYLCGTNTADLYKLAPGAFERVEYNRQKTENRRKDKAFISIKLIDEARPLFDKYAGNLPKRYSKSVYLNFAAHKGMLVLRKLLGEGFEDLDLYSARHSFAQIASEHCGYSEDEIGKALNHGSKGSKMTSRYIRKTWGLVDEIQAAVVALLPAPGSEVVNFTGKD